MIDIHSHILPGLDDGSKTMEESLKMVRQQWVAGFKTLIATPHVLEGTQYISPEVILQATDRLSARVAEEGIDIEILPGAENYIFPDMAKWAGEGKLLTLGNTGKYLLLEFPMLDIPQYTDQVFFELQVEGLTPVLAHPERYKKLCENPSPLLDWAKRGVLFQLDLRSLIGRYGPMSRDLAELMLRSDLIHFVGSDAHRPSRNNDTYLKALGSLRELIGAERFQEAMSENPKKVLEGKTPSFEKDYTLILAPKIKKKGGLWSLFR